ncbi:unnamed protein product [Brassica rapa subsp. trilocularis]
MRMLKTDHDHREIGLHKIILHEANSYLVISVSVKSYSCINILLIFIVSSLFKPDETMKTVKLTLLLLKHNIDLFWKTQFYN